MTTTELLVCSPEGPGFDSRRVHLCIVGVVRQNVTHGVGGQDPLAERALVGRIFKENLGDVEIGEATK